MTSLTKESAARLQKILSKRIGRELTEAELEQTYDSLMGFAIALIELTEPPIEKPPGLKKTRKHIKLPIASKEENILQYV